MDEARRQFLKIGSATGGAIVIATQLPSCGPGRVASAYDAMQVAVDAWLAIERDGTMTVNVDRAEMGQGILTTLVMLVAEELDVEPDRLRTAFATGRPEYVNELFDVQITAASSSTRLAWMPLRSVGATARQLFVEAAARAWQVRTTECGTERGFVRHGQSGRQLSYAELTAHLERRPREPVHLKDPSRFFLIGTPARRLDSAQKASGRAIFGIDVRMPGQLTAVVARPSALGATLRSFDRGAALAVPGVKNVVRLHSGVAVVAGNFWAALEGRRRLAAQWATPAEGVDSARMIDSLRAAAKGDGGFRVRNDGEPERSIRDAVRSIEATYVVPFQAHAPLEPSNATADVGPDSCTIWAPTQNPGGAQLVAAQITGLPLHRIEVRPTYLGGSFGRRQEIDFVAEAVELSAQIAAPVKVVRTFEEDLAHDFYRPAAVCRMQASIDARSKIAGWRHRIASTSIWKRVAPAYAAMRVMRWAPERTRIAFEDAVRRAIGLAKDPNLAEGAAEMPYSIPHVRVEYVDVDVGVPVGAWRSVGHSYNVFAIESFVDEIAAILTIDPCRLRARLLQGNPRMRYALDEVARRAGWIGGRAPPRFQGIAVYDYLGTIVAMVATVRRDEAGSIRLQDVHCVVDCGTVVNPAIARTQVEGGVAFGLGATTDTRSPSRMVP